jgi:hypothetical protein
LAPEAIKSVAYRAEIKEKLPRPKVQLGMKTDARHLTRI